MPGDCKIRGKRKEKRKTQNWEGKILYVFYCKLINKNHNFTVSHYVHVKLFQIRTSIKQLLTKHLLFTKMPQFHIKAQLFEYYCQKKTEQQVLPYKFYGNHTQGIYIFFFFASFEPLTNATLFADKTHDQVITPF